MCFHPLDFDRHYLAERLEALKRIPEFIMVEGSKPTVIATLQEFVDSEFCTKAEVLPPHSLTQLLTQT